MKHVQTLEDIVTSHGSTFTRASEGLLVPVAVNDKPESLYIELSPHYVEIGIIDGVTFVNSGLPDPSLEAAADVVKGFLNHAVNGDISLSKKVFLGKSAYSFRIMGDDPKNTPYAASKSLTDSIVLQFGKQTGQVPLTFPHKS